MAKTLKPMKTEKYKVVANHYGTIGIYDTLTEACTIAKRSLSAEASLITQIRIDKITTETVYISEEKSQS